MCRRCLVICLVDVLFDYEMLDGVMTLRMKPYVSVIPSHEPFHRLFVFFLLPYDVLGGVAREKVRDVT